MTADGTWNITMRTPMGNQAGTLVLKTDGPVLTGKMESTIASVELTDGKAENDALSWKVRVTKPLPLTMEFAATVAGDSIKGDAKLGAFGSATFDGDRVV